MELCQNLFKQGYRIYTDSFYTTQHLADLLRKRTYLIAAAKHTRSAIPVQLKDIENLKSYLNRGFLMAQKQ